MNSPLACYAIDRVHGVLRFQVRWQQMDKAIFLLQLAHEFQGRPLVRPGLDQHIKNFTLGIDGTPYVDQSAIDLEIDLVEMPSRMWLRPTFARIRRDLGFKMVHPAAHRLIGNHDSAFRQQILDVAEAQRDL